MLMFSSSFGPGPMNTIVENFNKFMGKAEVFAGNIWGHSKLHLTTFTNSCIFLSFD